MVDPNGYEEQQYYTDMNGVSQLRSHLDEQHYTLDEMRAMKQNYLMENVINTGYDAAQFAAFMDQKMGKWKTPHNLPCVLMESFFVDV